MQPGFAIRPKSVKPDAGHFEKAGVTPRKHLLEIRPTTPASTRSARRSPARFAAADIVDVTGVTRGKGTAGVMKRHGFKGLSSHGTASTAPVYWPVVDAVAVFPGLKMAGRMGVQKKTVQNLTVHAVDAERGLILVKGAIPGPKGALVVIRSAAKKGGNA